jgi:hypothetical protein
VNYPYPGKIRQDIYTLYCGQTYIIAAKKERSLEGESFDRLEQPNLEKNQFLLGASFSYMVKLYENRYDQEDTPRRFAYKVDEYSIMCLFRYGVTDSLEVWANGKYAFPHKTKYVYFNNITDNPDANYSRRYPENLYLDFGGLLRLRRDIQLSVNAGFMPEGSVYYQIDAPNIRGVYYDQEYLNYTTSDGTLRSRNFLFYDYYARVKLSKLF